MGSPPRMRGKHSNHTANDGNQRITPADAGKTSAERSSPPQRWDHPRGCGENQSASRTQSSSPGSPPRMRGKLPRCWFCAALAGITPADAGKTRHPCCAERNVWDHPRGCGENPIFSRFTHVLIGSPPRMRGKRCLMHLIHLTHRITPADAGKTSDK